MDKQTVYFLSSNHERSLMAEGWASRLNQQNYQFRSAGWLNARQNPLSIEAMKEICIDLSAIDPRIINESELRDAAIIVLIHDFENDDTFPLPEDLKEKVVQWHIRNPEKRSFDDNEKWVLFQEICEDIAIRIQELNNELNTTIH